MFGEQAHNPDVLNCLANLSSDEVFTPPGVANDVLDLLPADLWTDPAVTFLDPVCKSGVFLREIARRLDKGLETAIPDKQARLDHIFTRQVYGLGITELTGRLARRSLYGTKRADGPYSLCTAFTTEAGRVRFVRTEHAWEHGRCAFCRANEESYDRDAVLETHAYEFIHTTAPEEIFDMRFDVVVGNPPYQLSDGGKGGSANPIYNLFVEQAKKLNPRFLTMIIPSRWFTGGRGLDAFRKEMLADRRISKIVDYQDARSLFPGINLNGGASYFLWEKDHDGECEVTYVHSGGRTSTVTRPLDEHDRFVRMNEALSILRKVRTKGEPTFDGIVSPQKPFGFRTYFKGSKNSGLTDAVTLYRKGGTSYVSRSEVEANREWIDKFKVMIPMATDGNEIYPLPILTDPIVAAPGSVCTETYLVIGPFEDEKAAEYNAEFMRTRFFRFLLHLRKHTQHNSREKFGFIPHCGAERRWTDEDLFARYGISEDEQTLICELIRERPT